MSDSQQYYLFKTDLNYSRFEASVQQISREIGKPFDFNFQYVDGKTQQATDYTLKFLAAKDLTSSYKINTELKAAPTTVAGKWMDLETDNTSNPYKSL